MLENVTVNERLSELFPKRNFLVVNVIGIIKLGLLGLLLFILPVYSAIHHVSLLHFHTVPYSDNFLMSSDVP